MCFFAFRIDHSSDIAPVTCRLHAAHMLFDCSQHVPESGQLFRDVDQLRSNLAELGPRLGRVLLCYARLLKFGPDAAEIGNHLLDLVGFADVGQRRTKCDHDEFLLPLFLLSRFWPLIARCSAMLPKVGQHRAQRDSRSGHVRPKARTDRPHMSGTSTQCERCRLLGCAWRLQLKYPRVYAAVRRAFVKHVAMLHLLSGATKPYLAQRSPQLENHSRPT